MPRSGTLSTTMQAILGDDSVEEHTVVEQHESSIAESSCSLVRRTAKAPRRNAETRSRKDRPSATMRDAGPLPVAVPTAVEEYLSERRALLGTTPLLLPDTGICSLAAGKGSGHPQ
jgi:hypothetical protein